MLEALTISPWSHPPDHPLRRYTNDIYELSKPRGGPTGLRLPFVKHKNPPLSLWSEWNATGVLPALPTLNQSALRPPRSGTYLRPERCQMAPWMAAHARPDRSRAAVSSQASQRAHESSRAAQTRRGLSFKGAAA